MYNTCNTHSKIYVRISEVPREATYTLGMPEEPTFSYLTFIYTENISDCYPVSINVNDEAWTNWKDFWYDFA